MAGCGSDEASPHPASCGGVELIVAASDYSSSIVCGAPGECAQGTDLGIDLGAINEGFGDGALKRIVVLFAAIKHAERCSAGKVARQVVDDVFAQDAAWADLEEKPRTELGGGVDRG